MNKNYSMGALLLCTILVNVTQSHSQSGKDILLKSIPPSPQAAALAKAVEFPVGTFTGTPNISIPLYTISEGPVEVPVSLSYNNTGLKVEEEASWVGLGWTLNAGGAIVRVVKGKDDLIGYSYDDLQYELLPYSSAGSFDEFQRNENKYQCMFSNSNGSTASYSNQFFMNRGALDGEPDIYMYNFNGYSGKFILKDGQSIDLTNNDIQFKIVGSVFHATTPDGIVYVFGEEEFTKSVAYGQSGNAIPYTYYLTEIRDPYNVDNNVLLSYVSFKELLNGQYYLFHNMDATKDRYVPQMPKLNEHYAAMQGPGGAPVSQGGHVKSFTNVYIETKYLDEITFTRGSVKFEKSVRTDLYGYKLDAIKIYLKNPNEAPALLRQYAFSYNYFTSSMIGNDQLTVSSTVTSISPETYHTDYKSKRLKLNYITETGGTTNGRTYSFTYEESLPMPYKSSFAQDYWGYYNGSNGQNNTTLIPDVRRYLYHANLPPELDSWHGANREPSETHMRQGILKTFTHPTKGKTTFEYEINRYENGAEVQAGLIRQALTAPIIVMDYNRPTDISIPYKEFVVPAGNDALVDINVSLFCNVQSCVNGNITWNCGIASDGTANTLWANIKKWNGSSWVDVPNNLWDLYRPEIRNCSGPGDPAQHNYSTYLSPGTYRAYVSYPDQLGPNNGPGDAGSANMTLNVYGRVEQTYQTYSDKTGAGLRIKRMMHDPGKGTPVISDYEYTDGVMFKFPMFYWSELLMWASGGWSGPWFDFQDYILEVTFLHYLYPTTIVPYSYSNGALVGYKKVTEKVAGNGKKVYTYHANSSRLNFDLVELAELNIQDMNPSQYIAGVESTPDMKNGSLLKLEIFREGETNPIKRVTNTYTIVNPGVFWGFKFQNFLSNALINNEDAYCQGLITCFYPIHAGKVVQTQSIEENNIEGVYTTATKSQFKYDSKKHSQLTRQILENSDGYEITTLTLYSKDYSNSTGFISDLKNGNFLLPIETITYQTRASAVSILRGQVHNYKGSSLVGLPEFSYSLEPASPIPLSSFRFSNQTSMGIIPFVNTNNTGSLNQDGSYSNTKDYFLTYLANGALKEYEMKDGSIGSFVAGDHRSRPLASVKNARHDEICFTNFENASTTEGRWTISSTLRTSQPFTGQKAYDLDNGALSTTVPAKVYLLSYWKKDNSGTVSFTGALSSVARGTISRQGWTNEMWEVTMGATGLTVTGTAIIDDIRLHPVNAQMSTYTYHPLLGVTSVTDPNGVTQYYELDNLGRLKLMRDADLKIVKHFQYHYKD